MLALVTLVGNMGSDPRVRDTDYGKVVSASVAVNSNIKGEKITTWYRVTAWGKTGEMLARSKKGLRVCVAGDQTFREYVDRDGNKRSSLEVKASRVSLLDWPSDGEQEARHGGEEVDEEIPF